MKTSNFIFLLSVIAILIFCSKWYSNRYASTNNEIEFIPVDTNQSEIEINHKPQKKWPKASEIIEYEDSIRMTKVLGDALETAKPFLQRGNYESSYEVLPDSFYRVQVEIEIGNFFSEKDTHLLIRRINPETVYINIYKSSKKKIHEVFEYDHWNLTYTSDTIQDINGDNRKDFVVNWYGDTGCCLKAFSNVYLQRNGEEFSEKFEFINPTFSPKEQIVRGVCYGHPGYTEIYKYKWNGEKIDTLEYVYFQRNSDGEQTGKIILSDKRSHRLPQTKKILDAVPKEYEKIFGFDWFMGLRYSMMKKIILFPQHHYSPYYNFTFSTRLKSKPKNQPFL